MDKNLFQNDYITGNSKIGFEFCGQFKDDENILLTKLKDILNRDINYSTTKYKLLEPTDNQAVMTMKLLKNIIWPSKMDMFQKGLIGLD